MRPAIAVLVATALLTGPASARELKSEFTVEKTEFSIERIGPYDLVRLDAAVATGVPGEPLVPARRLALVLPQGAVVTTVTVSAAEWHRLAGTYALYPAQPPHPLSGPPPEFVPPRRDAYAMESAFPEAPVVGFRAGRAGGFTVVGVVVSPFRYWPSEGRLEYFARGTVVVEYELSGRAAPARPEAAIRELSTAIRALVANPRDVDAFAPPFGTSGRGSADLEPGDFRHVIVTSEALAAFLEPLSAWRTKQGLPSRVETVEDITARHPGWDDAEKLRNFIRDASETWGALYFTLAGDVGVVPVRNISQNDSLGGMYMPVDLYFSDLDGTWDTNGNHVYGEPGIDTLDMYSDVFVGRASIETPAEATTFVSKVLTYEKAPPPGYIENCLLPAVQLWQNYHGDAVNDSIAACTPPPWNDIKLYDSLGNLSRAAVIAAINDGVGFCHYSAHGNEDGIYRAGGDTIFHSVDAMALTNGDRLGVHNSIACISGAFDAGNVNGDCLAEHLMNNAAGGAAAVIMNTRVGLGTPPDMGPSEMLSLEFYRKAFREEVLRIGAAHATSKDVYVPLGDLYWWYDFCIAELTLFGDAAMAMWTAQPAPLTAEYPSEVPLGPSLFTVAVTGAAGPIEGALVCVASGDGTVYEYGYTSGGGDVTLAIEPVAEGELSVTVTAANHLPHEGAVPVVPSTGVAGPDDVPSVPSLALLSRNPTTAGALFALGVPAEAEVDVRIYDVAGRLVDRLASGSLDPGYHEIRWGGTRASGERVASGIYFCRASVGQTSMTTRLILIQ
jgi:hypothetical protein